MNRGIDILLGEILEATALPARAPTRGHLAERVIEMQYTSHREVSHMNEAASSLEPPRR